MNLFVPRKVPYCEICFIWHHVVIASYFLLVASWYIFSHNFILNNIMSLYLKEGYFRQVIVEACIFIQADNPCL